MKNAAIDSRIIDGRNAPAVKVVAYSAVEPMISVLATCQRRSLK